jgi:hypothetical protein
MLNFENKETLAENINHNTIDSPPTHQEIIPPKTRLERIHRVKEKPFTDEDEQELRSIMKCIEYNKAEIYDKIERKRIKYGRVKMGKRRKASNRMNPKLLSQN